MRRLTALSLLATAGVVALTASSACSSSKDDPISQGDGGSAGEGGSDTGGSSAGGTSGGTSSGGMAGGGGAGCSEDEWADPNTGECQVCPGGMGGAGGVGHQLECEDFWFDGSDTHWDPETKTLVLEQREGLPPIVSANVSFDYCGSDCVNVSSAMTVNGHTLSASFSQVAEPLQYSWQMELSVVDACGNEIDVQQPLSIDLDGNEEYRYFCE